MTLEELIRSHDRSRLESFALQNPTFGIDASNVHDHIQSRLALFDRSYSAIVELCTELKLPPALDTLWNLWLPLAMQIADWKPSDRALIQGFLGGQGTGKTTLTRMLTVILSQLGLRAVSWSIDDLYLSYVDRVALRTLDPRMMRRGPPGTHDVQLGIKILTQFQQGQFPIALPRFDKSAFGGEGDRTQPEMIDHADIVLFEGWFVGVRPIESEFRIAPIVTKDDRQFARDMNRQLRNYVPLWELLDRLIVLYVPDYQLSKQWRKQAEHQMIAQGKPGMSDAEIDQFVEYFWKALHPKLFITPIVEQSRDVDLVLEIGAEHTLTRIL
ncbi:glycerate kinase [Leptolyngbya sp. FACHB-17]|uniref:glycerate kinase n=1 Tax=unclassified Leptolyngbya TaxID=2650499 RepID=UPI001F552C59|nr:glycerate kinase [Leptolyngbya sp. FACHB-17]